MKLISWNVNGLRACMQKGFKEFFDASDADFFCLQETKLQEGQIDFAPEGYYAYWNYAEKKGYSGTAIFTKHKPLRVSYGIGIEEHDHEGRVITLEYENFYVITVYTPNSKRELLRLPYRMIWEDDFLAYLKKLETVKPIIYCGDLKTEHSSYTSDVKRKPVIICGDLNVAAAPIDLRNPKSNERNAGYTPEEREKMRCLLESGFVDTFRYMYPDKQEFSWWSYMRNSREKNIGWRIDYFLISEFAKSSIKDAGIMTDIYGSDHAPVLLDVDI